MDLKELFMGSRESRVETRHSKVMKGVIIVIALLFSPVGSIADAYNAQEYLDSERYFNEQRYAKALPLLEEEAKKGSKPAMYRLASMYENGLGVEVDYKKSSHWYKEAASSYSYVNTMQGSAEVKASFMTQIASEIDSSTDKEGEAFAIAKMDTNTPETKKLADSFYSGGFFGLQPYDTNYVLPISYATEKYPNVLADTNRNNFTPQQLEQYGHYDNNVEVEFQISLKKPLTYDLFGWNEYITAAYTQKVWWQLYSDSGPFRETNYLPEVFMNIPTSESVDLASGLKAVKFGFLHESNGREGYRSRSWNRLYLTGLWQWDNLFLASRIWHRISEDEKYEGYYEGEVDPATGEEDNNFLGDDNPNIEDYLGYGDIKIDYLYKEHQIGSLLRYNFGSGGSQRGAVEVDWSYPFFDSENTFWYAKVFSGYGESLIDYDRSVTKTSFGFSFSRGLY